MTTPSSCPGCGAKLEPGTEACPNCPMSFTAPEQAENNPFNAQSRLRDLSLPLAFLGLLGFGVWKLGVGLLRVAQDPTLQETGSMSTGGGPASTSAVAQTIADSIAQARGTEAAAPSGDKSAAPASGDGEQGGDGPGGVSIITEEAATAARAPREWRLRGTVYDLVTLRPVAGARLFLADNETNSRIETVTDAEGRYRTVVPRLRERGYLVLISKPGYAQSYAGPESAGVQDLDAGSRKELARQLARTVETPASLEPGNGAPFVTDFFLAPLDARRR